MCEDSFLYIASIKESFYLLHPFLGVSLLVSVALGIPEGMRISYIDVGCLLPTVTSVRTARQVIDALNAEGPKIDIILTEVDLPIAKGLKMLKYIMRDTQLRRIPIISKLICLFLFPSWFCFPWRILIQCLYMHMPLQID